MGFLDKAKALGEQAMTKADAALASATGPSPKDADPYFHDLGVLAFLEATGRAPADIAEQRARCTEAIQAVEGRGPLNFAMTSAAPPPPGVAASAPPPPGAAPTAPPAPTAAPAPPPPPGAVAPPPPPGAVAPPPPPSGG
jgi:hypothetical protein